MKINKNILHTAEMLLSLLFLAILFTSCHSIDTITTNHSLTDSDILVSGNGIFALGFFSPGKSKYRYVGIWYHKLPEQTVVWVANRNNPITQSSGVLSITPDGNFVLNDVDDMKFPVWSTNISTGRVESCVARLLDSGNLVLLHNESKTIVWQSFDYPTDTMLPGLKIGLNRKIGLYRSLTSWRSLNDPGTGDWLYKLNPDGCPQFFLYEGSSRIWRSSPWPWDPAPTPGYLPTSANNQDEIYYTFILDGEFLLSRIVLKSSGLLQRLTWDNASDQWRVSRSEPKHKYEHCGPNSVLNSNNLDSLECMCLPGFEPKSLKNWYLRDGSAGCVRKREKTSSICRNGEGFIKVKRVKLPDTSVAALVNESLSSTECEQLCLRNCSCKAFACLDIERKGYGCLTWYDELRDTVEYTEGRDMYVRVDAVELAEIASKRGRFLERNGKVVIPVVSAALNMLLIFVIAKFWLRKMRKRKVKKRRTHGLLLSALSETELAESRQPSDLPFFDLYIIATATKNFSPANKLGQGGFGTVYKGELHNGRQIAVKRLSQTSGQGMEEFKNEVMLLTRLQHRNLVKLLGCCIQGEEQMLIYEYLPNKSLDYFIFDESRRSVLDWRKCFDIIVGIARGILYLHHDSRLRIIHRDLKASNILLDADMMPKVSDFGMARIFLGDEVQNETKRVVGTYFGVMLLEIITGKRSNNSFPEDPSLTLIGHVWNLWRERRALEIVDSVVLMLTGEVNLPCPKQPAFILGTSYKDPDALNPGVNCSLNQVTITRVVARFCNSDNIINTNQSFKEGDLLVSSGTNKFAFGFFSPGSSSKKYLGIWFHKVSKRSAVWVANRNNPANGSSAVLSINQNGNLVLYNDPNQKIEVWSTNVTEKVRDGCIAQLLDSGNLVLLEATSKRIVWQSFDYPTDTIISGMKLGQNQKAGLEWYLTSWKSPDDPGTGDYSFKLDPTGSPQFILYKGLKPHWRAHVWPKRKFSNVYSYTYVFNQHEMYSIHNLLDTSVILRIVVDHLGFFKWITWHESDGQWKDFWSVPKYSCDFYGKCGAYSLCSPSNPDIFECSCLPGYEPRSPRDWYFRDASHGCVNKRLESSSVCGHGDGFVKLKNVKLADTSKAAWIAMNLSQVECEQECLRNCSCSAYSMVQKDRKEKGCLVWYGELIDTVDHMDDDSDMHVRVDAVELANIHARKSNGFLGNKEQEILVLSAGAAWFTILFFVYLWFRRRKKKGLKKKLGDRVFDPKSGSIYYKNTIVANELEGDICPPGIAYFDLSSIIAATNNFSPANKLGEGGFGSVYKGQLTNGQEVAVKQLSENSVQGIEEFKNEVMLIAKLQHRNLVKLLGCCFEGGEQMLIYEYLPNKSLNLFLFDENRRLCLDWRKRFNIINGIARGILYLHQDSRLRIIHRDLKSSNILLDEEMNPKISDFGTARIFRADQIHDKTKRVVGTYGYMSPEYAVFGKFSIKSDVFSFGVIVLEIVTGKKNNESQKTNTSLSLIGHVWDLWREDRALEIVDSLLDGSYSPDEALRSIHIGLLCVQENVEDRPTMLEVVLMLSSEATLRAPKQPPFVFSASSDKTNISGSSSINEVTITKFEAR
ncbi:G-type lectin S-receptor-like serine/threonine-protein kinase RKS1 [Mercurialis annua]|uniref:G-type lectin S-receptor-like serine/threonine-protein kinase RKS1 n=1 Tax=Mercurialis annua TaxID=3986 RepID=UPI002160DFD8|nr:G-type lectin S-receptor-like serine/threonine-protein kinase RKS1 [Mercurialis annua]